MSKFVVKIDRGYIQYGEYYAETKTTEYGVVADIKYAKKYSRENANRILREFKKKGEYAKKIKVEE